MKKKAAIRSHHSPYFYIVFAAVMFAIGISAAFAVTKVTGQTSGKAIYACAQNKTGNLRMVTSGSSCHPDETAVSWSIQGPSGASASTSVSGLPYECDNCVLYPYADKFKGNDYSNAQIQNSEFLGADLTGVIFKGSYLQSDDFSGADLTGADFSNQSYDLNHSTAPSSWSYSDSFLQFTNANLTNVTFANSGTLHRFNFNNANLQNVNFSNDKIEYSNFKGAQNVSTANITGVTWVSDTCPDGTNSSSDGNTCAGHF